MQDRRAEYPGSPLVPSDISLFYSSSHAILDNVGGDDDMERPSLSLDPDPSYLIRFYYTYLSVTLLLKEGGYPIPSPPPPFYVPIHVTYLRSLRASKEKRRPWPTRTPAAEEDSPTLTKK